MAQAIREDLTKTDQYLALYLPCEVLSMMHSILAPSYRLGSYLAHKEYALAMQAKVREFGDRNTKSETEEALKKLIKSKRSIPKLPTIEIPEPPVESVIEDSLSIDLSAGEPREPPVDPKKADKKEELDVKSKTSSPEKRDERDTKKKSKKGKAERKEPHSASGRRSAAVKGKPLEAAKQMKKSLTLAKRAGSKEERKGQGPEQEGQQPDAGRASQPGLELSKTPFALPRQAGRPASASKDRQTGSGLLVDQLQEIPSVSSSSSSSGRKRLSDSPPGGEKAGDGKERDPTLKGK